MNCSKGTGLCCLPWCLRHRGCSWKVLQAKLRSWDCTHRDTYLRIKSLLGMGGLYLWASPAPLPNCSSEPNSKKIPVNLSSLHWMNVHSHKLHINFMYTMYTSVQHAKRLQFPKCWARQIFPRITSHIITMILGSWRYPGIQAWSQRVHCPISRQHAKDLSSKDGSEILSYHSQNILSDFSFYNTTTIM